MGGDAVRPGPQNSPTVNRLSNDFENRQHQHGLGEEADRERQRTEYRQAQCVHDQMGEGDQKYTAQA